ncbi:protein distal antenna [Lasius niger]|uniref:Protein distal antenna n=1 Tax=Lasius niger TaxID=67767 RepID=A0A0J7NIC0_LASNI|nr:protein distal antenna [Lasius niger]
MSSRNETPQRTPGRRSSRSLSDQEKLSAISKVRDGETKASVARDIGVPESTLRGWCKAEHNIVNKVNTMKNFDGSFDKLSPSIPGSSRAKESSGEEAAPSTKRIKMKSDMPATSSTPVDHNINHDLISSYFYNRIKQLDMINAHLIRQVSTNNEALLSYSMPGYSTSHALTASGIVKGDHVVEPTLCKPLEKKKKDINDIAQQLSLQQQLKQHQSANSLNLDFFWQLVNHLQPAVQNMDGRALPGNSVNNNNKNNIHKNNNQARHHKSDSTGSLPPGIHKAAEHGKKFVTWLKQQGTPVVTFQQVKMIDSIVETLVAWVKSKETPSNFVDKQNSIS